MPDVDKKVSEIFVDNPVTPASGDLIYLSRSGVDAAALISSLVTFIDPVFGPASSTLNAVPRFANTGGKLLKNSALTIADDGKITGDSAGAGVYELTWRNNNASGSPNPIIANYYFGENSVGVDTLYASETITTKIATAGAEEGQWTLFLASATGGINLIEATPQSLRTNSGFVADRILSPTDPESMSIRARLEYVSNTAISSIFGIQASMELDSAATITNVIAGDFPVYIEGANTVTTVHGVEAYIENIVNGTVGTMCGIMSRVYNDANGNVTLMEGYATSSPGESLIGNYGSGTIGTLIHFHAYGVTNSGGGAITTIQGLKIENLSGITGVTTAQAINYADKFIVDSTGNIVGQTGYHEMVEMAAPSNGAANTVRLFAQDNGAGKTQLMAIFASGVAQQILIEA